MAEAVGLIFILFGILAVSVVVFGAWVAFTVVKWVFVGVFGMFAGARPPALPHVEGVTAHRCSRPGCQTSNPGAARFCRRCGGELDGAIMTRRAAVW